MSEIESTDGPVAPHRVIGTPSATTAVVPAPVVEGQVLEGHLPAEPEFEEHAKNAERVIAALFILAFLAGCGFIAAYVGIEVHSVDQALRSNMALGTSLAVAL